MDNVHDTGGEKVELLPIEPLEDPPTHVGPIDVMLTSRTISSSPTVTFGSMDIWMRNRTGSMGLGEGVPSKPKVGPRGRGKHRGGSSGRGQGSGSPIRTQPTPSHVGMPAQDTWTGGGAKEKIGRLPGTRILRGLAAAQQRASLKSWMTLLPGPRSNTVVKSDISVRCSQSADREKAKTEVVCKLVTGPLGPEGRTTSHGG